ncbi:hypothetical protein [Arthrobacter silvisoli]|nr:hypothetical protein [Arthrobacter silvisoli]
MKSFAQAWPDFPMLQQPVATLPWGHNLVLSGPWPKVGPQCPGFADRQ